MNKYKIQFSKDARKDLKDIYIYIKYSFQEPVIAKKLIDKIKKEIYKLEDNPTIYAIIRDEIIKKREIRKVKVNNYIVFYRLEENNKIVEIVRIMYGRRNWTNIL
ncbi:MAG: type II toxin-antitoxin system RelE/ParE family toxin [Clostridia bacterium]|nr:type II toxin-antitoxin system RelE/ParE family toxin [Clostridia bacterium]